MIAIERGTNLSVKLSTIIRRRIRQEGDGVSVVADVNAAVAGSLGESGATKTSVSSRSTVVQRSGRTVEDHTTPEKEERHDR